MTDRYPGYDVMDKRNTLSWNDATRDAVDRRLAIHRGPRFFTADEWLTLRAVCARVLPQPADRRDPVPLAAHVDDKMHRGELDGYRYADLPPQDRAWKLGLAAIDAVAQKRRGVRFHLLSDAEQDAILQDMQDGVLDGGPEWRGMPAKDFFSKRVVHDVATAYYAHPVAWSEIGFGGPASPRGYVRLDADRQDPWEATESKPGRHDYAYRENRRVV